MLSAVHDPRSDPHTQNAHAVRRETAHEPTGKQPPTGAQLGNNAKSRATVDSQGVLRGEFTDRETGEIVSPKYDAAAVRCERYALQSVARSILPKSRTAKCLRLRQAHRQAVEVWRSLAHGSAVYAGLQTCGAVWVCPVCGAKVTERRRVDLQGAIEAWKAQGGAVWLLTLTHAHGACDALAGLLAAEQRALHAFFRNRDGRALAAALGLVGHVRAWEVTHGRLRARNNGWHPHFHVLLFLRALPAGGPEAFQAEAFRVWANACRLAGLPAPSEAHGARIDDGDQAAQYVAKMGVEEPRVNEPRADPAAAQPDAGRWGLGAEMTKGHIKRAKDGETPFDLLRAVFADGDPEAVRLFREFAAAFHGKRQLVWSRGLRELLGLDVEQTDAELEGACEADAEILGRLVPSQWLAVVAADLRAQLLELARHGWDPVERLLCSLGVPS
jgi:hypothetical protein